MITNDRAKHISLADLAWLLLPQVALNQFALADAKPPNSQTVPAGHAWRHRPQANLARVPVMVSKSPIKSSASEISPGFVPCMIRNRVGLLHFSRRTACLLPSVEVKTGKRRILEYLFSPLAQTVSSAMRER